MLFLIYILLFTDQKKKLGGGRKKISVEKTHKWREEVHLMFYGGIES